MNSGDKRSPSTAEEYRNNVVSHRLLLHAVCNPNAPHGFDFSLDPYASGQHRSRGIPGPVVFVWTRRPCFGGAPSAASIPASEELAAEFMERFSCVTVLFLAANLHEDFYNGLYEKYLWPMMIHYMLPLTSSHGYSGPIFKQELYRACLTANTHFAEPIFEIRRPDEDQVFFIHAYHNWARPTILRNKSPCSRIGLVLNSPFQAIEDALCDALFPTNSDAFSFSCSRYTDHWQIDYESIDYFEELFVVVKIHSIRANMDNLSGMLLSSSETAVNASEFVGRSSPLSVDPCSPRRTRSQSKKAGDTSGFFQSSGLPYIAQLSACNPSSSTGGSDPSPVRRNEAPQIRLILDSGASMHAVGDPSLLSGLHHLPQDATRSATLPDGSQLPIIGVGTIQMNGFNIPDVYLVDGVTVNLISVGRLATNHNISCCFYSNRCRLVMLGDGTRVGEAVLDDDGVYGLRFLQVPA